MKSQTILITGCSSGFGLLTVARLARKGHKIIATMRDLDKREVVLKLVQSQDVTIDFLALDVTEVDSIRSAVAEIDRKYGRVDVLVNNAGYGIGGFFEDLSQEQIRKQFDVNFFGAQNVTREIIPMMRRQREGKIINISSVSGFNATPALGAYCASKWALEAFSESLYYEMKLWGIKVCLIEPGTYRTKIFHENAQYANRFDDPQSPYYRHSQKLKSKVMDYVNACRKDPEQVAALIEKLINSSRPPLRSFPDIESKVLYTLRKALPFKIFSRIIQVALS